MDTKKRLIFLDYLRVFAFISVLIGHKYFWYFDGLIKDKSTHASLKLLLQALHPLYFVGGAGVTVFFLISGYIIPATLKNGTALAFAIKRFFRIYPLYIFAVLLESILLAIDGKPKEIKTVLLQITPLGDFFKIPYALGQVEWTLRIEIVFYVYMAVLKTLGLLNRSLIMLPYVLLMTIVVLYIAPPFPISENAYLATGYFSVYFPLLLIGTMVWLHEERAMTGNLLVASILLTFMLFLNEISIYLNQYSQSHYALSALLVFFTAYVFKDRFEDSKFIRELSEMTFGVYLFHNWLINYFNLWIFGFTGMSDFYLRYTSLGLVFVASYLTNKMIEKKGILVGKLLANKLNERFERSTPIPAINSQL